MVPTRVAAWNEGVADPLIWFVVQIVTTASRS
jgi:hypothetical protein